MVILPLSFLVSHGGDLHEWHIGRRHPVPTTAWGIPVVVVVVVTIQGATRQTGSIEGGGPDRQGA